MPPEGCYPLHEFKTGFQLEKYKSGLDPDIWEQTTTTLNRTCKVLAKRGLTDQSEHLSLLCKC